jgi:predicted TIM-barrel fold metal-dependent hydrolase
MIHCGDTFATNAKLKYAYPLNVDEVATDNPDLKIIICHLGNPWILDCQEVLYKKGMSTLIYLVTSLVLRLNSMKKN